MESSWSFGKLLPHFPEEEDIGPSQLYVAVVLETLGLKRLLQPKRQQLHASVPGLLTSTQFSHSSTPHDQSNIEVENFEFAEIPISRLPGKHKNTLYNYFTPQKKLKPSGPAEHYCPGQSQAIAASQTPLELSMDLATSRSRCETPGGLRR